MERQRRRHPAHSLPGWLRRGQCGLAPRGGADKGDDPEIYFNEKTVRYLGIAEIFSDSRRHDEILERADTLGINMNLLNRKLIDNYGTLDGINYTANAIIDFLKGKDISSYRKIKACLK